MPKKVQTVDQIVPLLPQLQFLPSPRATAQRKFSVFSVITFRGFEREFPRLGLKTPPTQKSRSKSLNSGNGAVPGLSSLSRFLPA